MDDLAAPLEPPVNILMLPETKTIETVSVLAEGLEMHIEDKLTEFRNKSNAEMECCENSGEGDQCSERQRITALKVKDFKGFHNKMFFGYSGEDGTQCLG